MTNQEMLDEFNDLRSRWGVEIAVPGAGEPLMSEVDEMRMEDLREALDVAGVDYSIGGQSARPGVRSSKGVLGMGLTPEQIADHEILDDLEAKKRKSAAAALGESGKESGEAGSRTASGGSRRCRFVYGTIARKVWWQ
ncbi:MAG TPA: hypothetical protein EYQ31_04295 [Candidatus Handelsmanbacteria bacterium]|nr:hypothetical protein [Candidatus Handelsmanbacteria bacterium]